MKVPYTITNQSITVVLGNDIHVIPSDEKTVYDNVKNLLRESVHDKEAILNAIDKSKAVEVYSKGLVKVTGGVVYYKDEPVHNTLTDRILELMDEGFDIGPWAVFVENLMDNPSYRARECLYNFLEQFHAPLTEDGCFIAFKRVTQDFKDIYTKTFDNSPGTVVVMDRKMVDDDPNRTCSAGLHVAADRYLDSYASTYNSKTVMVKVNPADVVSVPKDYNFAKMRVCKYEVLAEIDPMTMKEVSSKSVITSVSKEPVLQDFSELQPKINETVYCYNNVYKGKPFKITPNFKKWGGGKYKWWSRTKV